MIWGVYAMRGDMHIGMKKTHNITHGDMDMSTHDPMQMSMADMGKMLE
jgi:hypothetical protein